MFRSYMPEENGMIFVFSTPHEVSMWMKSTYIPLDMLFLDPNLYVNSIKESAVPLSEDIIRGPKNAAYVLELNAGQIEQYHIKIGDKLDISQCPALVAK